MRFRDRILGLLGLGPERSQGAGRKRGPATHVIVLDGTMSSLRPGCETNAGKTYKLLCEVGQKANLTVYYEAGVQWQDWSKTWDVASGKGINRQIERAYGVLASRYRPGDKIVLIGYSRGAFAVRSLAGVIDMVGLVKAEHATARNIRSVYRYYRLGSANGDATVFTNRFCHDEVAIEAVAAWDTVKALGLRLPVFWRWAEARHEFHNHRLGPSVRHGFHALALDETRDAFTPVLWSSPEGWAGKMEQVWFKGTHGDIGGQLTGYEPARPLANIPLVWMLERLEDCGLELPVGWRGRFPCDPSAPMVGTWQGWGKLFVSRHKRVIGQDPSERLHDSVPSDHRFANAMKEPQAPVKSEYVASGTNGLSSEAS